VEQEEKKPALQARERVYLKATVSTNWHSLFCLSPHQELFVLQLLDQQVACANASLDHVTATVKQEAGEHSVVIKEEPEEYSVVFPDWEQAHFAVAMGAGVDCEHLL
jgi:3-oxoacyl-(acyl-carrier-protein) synthase